ncbi:MAG: sigma-70 family RNA polymerase sigma factor [Planctomycetes bacterium]|nr:sigma-70 family RNA polymerase sigma factor [Planctomycetota bacterium]
MPKVRPTALPSCAARAQDLLRARPAAALEATPEELALRATLDLDTRRRRWIMRLCVGVPGRRELSDDALQIALVRYWIRARRGDAPAHADAWMRRTALSIVLRWHSQERARPPSELHETPVLAQVLAVHEVDPLELEEARTAVTSALDTVTARQREIVRRHVFEDQTLECIAQELGVSPSTVRTQYARARKHLREVLSRRSARSV